MKRAVFVVYGAVCYLVSVGTLLYAVGFVGAALVPRSVDAGGPAAPLGTALGMDAVLLTLFAVQHSGMARRGFKAVWTRIVPAPIERSTYVLSASVCLLLLFYFWRPIPIVVWHLEAPGWRMALLTVAGLGWGIALFATFLINHFELFGLRQVYLAARRKELPYAQFRTPLLYKVVRHPLYLGFILAFWAAPTMTVGHLVFAVAMLGYIVVAVQLEERDLVRAYGARYLAYRQEVRGLVPIPRSPASDSAVTGSAAHWVGELRSGARSEPAAPEETPGSA